MPTSSAKNPQEYLTQAEAASTSGQYRQAIKAYKNYEKLVPLNAEQLEKIGALLNLAGDEWGAIDYYNKALSVNPKSVASCLGLARIRNKLLYHGDALEHLNRALEINEKSEEALTDKLFTLNELNRHNEMRLTAEKLLELNPQSFEALCYRARALTVATQEKDCAAAFEDLAKARKLKPEDPLAVFFEGLLCIQTNDIDKGLVLLGEAYDSYKQLKMKSYVDQITFYYHHYKDRASIIARKKQFGKTSLEEQLAIFQRCGLAFRPDKDVATILHQRRLRASSDMEESPTCGYEDPFQDLLFELAFADCFANAEAFNTDCVGASGIYKSFAETFVKLALGDFPLEDIDDCVDHLGDGEEAGQAWLSFCLRGKKYNWKAKYKGKWLDVNVLKKLGIQFKKVCPHKSFALIYATGASSSVVALCLNNEQLEQLKTATGLDIVVLDK